MTGLFEMKDTTAGLGDAPLRGIRVLDMTHMLAGPYCTWLLGGLGADIIKLERPGSGDFTRAVAPFSHDESIYFLSVNRNKRSITLNLKDERGRALFHKLIARTDILVENNRAGVMDRLKLGYDDLKRVKPELIYASISGFGQTGPYRNKACFDAVAQAMSGMMSVTGEPDGSPVRVGASIGDIGASLFATIGILSALQQRNATGRGACIDVAMLDSQLALLENAVARYLNAGEIPKRLGSRHPLVAPFQAFRTADEPIVVCVDTNEQWQRLCGAMGLANLATDSRFLDGSLRAKNHGALEPLLQAGFTTRTREDWLGRLEEADVPSGPINTIPEAISDPQIRHREMIVEVPPGSGQKFVGIPIKLRSSSPLRESEAPKLGEHTAQILAELGIEQAEINDLKNANVV